MKLFWCLGLCWSIANAAREGKHEENALTVDGPQGAWAKQRMEDMRRKMDLDQEVVSQFTPHADDLLGESRSSSPKVAFLFLIMDDFPWTELWTAFFKDAPENSYSIYIHRAAASPGLVPLSQFGAIDVPRVKTAWCAIFGAEVASLYAAMQDPNNVQFVFVSDSSVPLKPFGYVYNELVGPSPSSKICLALPAKYQNYTEEYAQQESTRSCTFRDFFRDVNPMVMKHHQWAVFNRPHAKMIVKYGIQALDVFAEVWMKAAPDLQRMGAGCSDEAVPLVALFYALQVENKSTGNPWTDLSRLGVEQNCLTLVHWRNCFVGSDLELRPPMISPRSAWKLVDEVAYLNSTGPSRSPAEHESNGFPYAFQNITEAYLRKMVAQNFMFARKFHLGAHVISDPAGKPWFSASRASQSSRPLQEVLPQLWSQLNWQKARMSQWSHLETSGRHSALRKP